MSGCFQKLRKRGIKIFFIKESKEIFIINAQNNFLLRALCDLRGSIVLKKINHREHGVHGDF
jgi:hypothetical protein